MAVECPVCREPIPWSRMFLTPAWGRWRCRLCESLLAVNVVRRLMLLPVWIVGYITATRIIRVSAQWETWFLALAALLLLVVHFAIFERARVIERCGFRCKGCGYDLQGQVELRCPECGKALDEEDRRRLRRHASRTATEESPARRRIVALVGVVILFALTVSVVIGTHVWRTASVQTAGGPQVRLVLDAIKAHIDSHDSLPAHALELAISQDLHAGSFVSSDTLTQTTAIPLGDTTLAGFDGLATQRQNELAQTAAGALPDETIAHRLGDLVFTYHGIDPARGDPGLWAIVWSPDPDQNALPLPSETIALGLVGGEVIQVKIERFGEALDAQNELRSKFDLPPLTNPFVITHARPMVRLP